MSALTPAERRMRAQLAAHTSWANTPDPSARTANARVAAVSRFEREVDPEGTMEPAERARRARHAELAHYKRMALASAIARRKGGGAT